MPQGGHHVEPLEIQLESNELVFRGFTGDEASWTPAVCNGSVILNLAHPTDLKEVSLIFTGVAKVTWRDSSTHHHDHPLFFHDFNFLNPSSHTNREDARREHHHVHTLKAGRHVFPFSLTVPGSLPASLRTYSGTGVIEYKLKAIAQRPGFAATDWKAKKMVRIARSFGADAVEYNQTLEIENTWPGKVMYSFTLPHKAYAAGDTIPVAVKFSPLAKGVRIVSLITTIREHTTVYSKNSSHSEARDATVVKYNFVADGSHGPSSGASTPHHPPGPARIESTASLRSMGGWGSGMSTPTTPGFNTPFHGGAQTPAAFESPNGNGFPFRPQARRPKFQLGGDSTDDGHGEEDEPEEEEEEQEEEDDGQDTEVDVVVDVQVPIWTAPSHTVHPIFINHKIKWSAFIKNPDGHVSELRCALPIHILASCLQEESRLASAGSRNLLFGESGVLAHSDVPQVDLPSYQDHVMDRVANADTANYFSASQGFAPTPWSARNTPTGTPGISPPQSRPPSRPPSPERRGSHGGHGHSFGGFGGFSALSALNAPSRRGSAPSTPAPATPPATEPEQPEMAHPEDHRNWVDSELLSTLALSDHAATPPSSNPASRPSSRPGSRPSSRPSSRPGSRAASPEREPRSATSTTPSVPISASPQIPSPAPQQEERPPLSRSHTSGSFFNLHFSKPLRPLTSFSRNSSASNLRDMLHMSSGDDHGGSSRPGNSRRGSMHGSRHAEDPNSTAPSPSALSSALAAHAARAGPSGQVPRQPLAVDAPASQLGGGGAQIHTHPLMSNSPSHHSATASPVSASPATRPDAPIHSPSFTQHYGAQPLSLSIPTTPQLGSPSPGPSTPAPQPQQQGGDVDFLSQVPSYDVAARGFLGGGVVPLSKGLPNYEDVCPSPGGTRMVPRLGEAEGGKPEGASGEQAGARAQDFAEGQ
ncbi:hypothetical protein JCM10213_000293 [Rhodosporidiobolus nylandii]